MDFLINNSIYVTLIIAVLIMAAILFYLNNIDARVRKLERREENTR
jgi:hypothetical protein